MAEIDYRLLTLFSIFKYKNNKEKIASDNDELYKLANEYLAQNGANPEFLNKPAVVERVKKIIFGNLLLGENTKFSSDGMITEKGENYIQKLGVLKNGSVIFYREYDGKKRITSFDMFEDDVVCRYLEYGSNNHLVAEKRVIIDEYGFDKEYNDTFFDLEKKFRETFNPIISFVDNTSILAISDTGNYSITGYIDKYFINRKLESGITDEILNPDLIDCIKYDDINDVMTSYPISVEIKDEVEINNIKKNFDYLKSRYPNVEEWFINRYGKSFLINNNIISKNSEITEKSLVDKIGSALESEVTIYFQNQELQYDTLSKYARKMYEAKKFFKSFIFLQKMDDEGLQRFVENNSEYSPEFLADVISFVQSDELKTQLLDERDDFSIRDKITVIETLKSEDKKTSYYDDLIDDIIEYDTSIISEKEAELQEDVYSVEFAEPLSQRVLDSLSEHDNLYKFLMSLKYCAKLRYEYIKDFSLDELYDIVAIGPDTLELEEYMAILRTGKIPDDDIIDLLENNWEDGLDLAKKDESIDIKGELSYSLKVFALLKMRDEDKKIKFLESHIDDFGADEITEILKDLGDSEIMLELAKKFELPKQYYYDLVILCQDDDKFECLKEDGNMDEEDISTIISSVYDMPRAFKYVEGIDRFNAMQKVRILSRIESELYDDPELMKKIKLDFLKANRDAILNSVENQDDLDYFNSYIRDYGLDTDKEDVIEDLMEKLSEQNIPESDGEAK